MVYLTALIVQAILVTIELIFIVITTIDLKKKGHTKTWMHVIGLSMNVALLAFTTSFAFLCGYADGFQVIMFAIQWIMLPFSWRSLTIARRINGEN
jgi:hypothetical protein